MKNTNIGVPNVMTIDLEDWFCVENLTGTIRAEDWPKCESRIEDSTTRILDLLHRHEVEATFFVLGWVAERHPDLIREIEKQGHEIASHGYSHRPLIKMSPAEFDEDLKRALEVTRQTTHGRITGFRAPSFSITQKTLWAFDVLAENGFSYDSSIYPIGFHPEYGIPDAPLDMHKRNTAIVEVPLSVAEVAGMRIPCSGGGYFRLLPYPLTRFLLRNCRRHGRPIVFYLHPWEVDPGQPRVSGLPALKRFRHYHNLGKTMDRLNRLLTDFEFTSIRKLLALTRSLPNQFGRDLQVWVSA